MAKSKRASSLRDAAVEAALSLCDQEVRLLRAVIDAALSEAKYEKDPKRALARVIDILKASQEPHD